MTFKEIIENIISYLQENRDSLSKDITTTNFQPLPYLEAKTAIELYTNLEDYIVNYLLPQYKE